METVEISLHSSSAKRRAMNALRSVGYNVESGPIRLAYPFCVSATVEMQEVDDVLLIARALDPSAGQIITTHDRSGAHAVRTR